MSVSDIVKKIGCRGKKAKGDKTKKAFFQIIAEQKQAFLQEDAALIQEKHNFHRKYETLADKHAVFLTKLSDEELQVYEKYISNTQTNLAARELYSKALDKTLTEENAQELATLSQEYANLEIERIALSQKIQSYNNRVAEHNKFLQLGIKTIKQSGVQRQQYWQNYYKQQYQQQLPNSLNDVEVSIINLGSGTTIAPTPR